MPINLNFGSTNRLMKTLMWYFMQSRLGKESHEQAMLRQQQRQTSIEERGIVAYERKLEEKHKQFIYDIAKHPQARRLGEQIFVMKQQGQDTSTLDQRLLGALEEKAMVGYVTATGQPWTEDTARRAARQFANAAFNNLVGQAASTMRLEKRLPGEQEARELRREELKERKTGLEKEERMLRFYETRERALMSQRKKAEADLEDKQVKKIDIKLEKLRNKMDVIIKQAEKKYGIDLKPTEEPMIEPAGITDEEKIAFLTNYLMTTHNIPPDEASRLAREAILGVGTIQ